MLQMDTYMSTGFHTVSDKGMTTEDEDYKTT
jgi:hypothetical protein